MTGQLCSGLPDFRLCLHCGCRAVVGVGVKYSDIDGSHEKGFLTGAFSNVVLNDRYGFGKVVLFCVGPDGGLGTLIRNGFMTGHRAGYVVYPWEPLFLFGSKEWRAHRISFPGSVLQVVGYSIEAAALPFPAFLLGYAINGIGLALQVRCLCWVVFAVVRYPSRMLRQTVLWLVSKTMQKLKWDSCTQYVCPFVLGLG